MRTLGASELLQVWERALDAPALACGLWMLQLDGDAQDASAWLDLSLGQRDARLLQLHARLFGRALEGVATCPACQSTVEVSLDSRTLELYSPDEPMPDERVFDMQSAGHDLRIRFRPVSCADL
ncbi:MAG TPA: hypothetical protein VFG49_13880, partial [Dyella sp.]|nr:hypothetical protein [Dyella sp.]